MLSSVRHPGLVRAHTLEDSDHGETYMVMDLLDGVPASAFVRRLGSPSEPLRVVAVQGIIADVAAAAEALHRAGWVHRDIKAANVMVLSGGQSILIDPGAACRSDVFDGGGFVGTRAYAPPEQLLGQAVDARADVYALGILSYRLLTGQSPFPTDCAHQVLGAKLRQQPPALAGQCPTLPAPVAARLDQTLRPQPRDRPTMRKLVETLSRDGEAVSVDTQIMLGELQRAGCPLSSALLRDVTGLSGDALVAALQEAVSAGRVRYAKTGWRLLTR